ncbi:hypothetical protein LRS06_14300 [Hymenobacter sp. J193]|uniref:hypothetical protein n=1 Tax=Hymenobacter sp. J193 TaxID=2898429 RepID=UPI002150ED44|nr:hypothetical protein [Hymenobacter sp. J193]MCR5888916.1 hypothetical protein [Hymenobacter sp. J193]
MRVQPDGFLDPAWFTVPRLDTFRVVYRTSDTSGFDLGTEKLVKLTAAQEQRYLQIRPRRPAERQQAPYYFYSLQENTPARQEITVLHDDGEYLFQLLRLVYDARHQLIGQQEVAHFAADGSEMSEAYGRFETPARFRITAVQTSVGAEDSLSVTANIDSTVTLYTVAHDKFQPASQRKYQRTKIEPLQD